MTRWEQSSENLQDAMWVGMREYSLTALTIFKLLDPARSTLEEISRNPLLSFDDPPPPSPSCLCSL